MALVVPRLVWVEQQDEAHGRFDQMPVLTLRSVDACRWDLVSLRGLIQHIHSPSRLYADPANVFVAGFIGSPPMNLLPGKVSAAGIELPFGTVPLPDAYRDRLSRGPVVPDVIVGIRPEAFADTAIPVDAPLGLSFDARIVVAETMGSEVYAYFDLPVRTELPADLLESVERDDASAMGARGDARQVVARLPVATRVAAGQRARLVLDPADLKLFDVESGNNLLAAAPAFEGSSNGASPVLPNLDGAATDTDEASSRTAS